MKDQAPRSARRRAITAAAGLLVMFFICAMIYARPAFVERVDRGIYDIFLRSMAGGEISPVPVLVDIDERSIDALGQWPWPRYVTAEVIAAICDSGALAVGVDILMAEPDRTSLSQIIRGFSDQFGVETTVTGPPEELMDNDTYFASVIEGLPVVLGVHLTDEAPPAQIKSFPITELRAPGAPPLADHLERMEGALDPIEPIRSAAVCSAFMNAAGDRDGIFRSVPLFLSNEGEPVAGLALATLALGAGDKGIVVRVSQHGPESVRVAGVEVPISRGASMPVAFRGPGRTFPTYSAIDVLTGEVGPEQLAGRVVFFGSTAAGLRDLRPTPFDNVFPGLELHAAAADTILSKRFIAEPLWTVGVVLFVAIGLGLISLAIFAQASPKIAFPAGAAMAAAVWYASSWLMTERSIYISPLFSLASIILQGAQSFSIRSFMDERDKRVLRRAFANYVSPEIVGRIIERGGVASLSGETRNITLLFTDLRGFTSMTERMQPTDVSAMLGMYFTPMTQIVRSSGGTLDKFVGDALMAFWNAPLDVPDHPAAAIASLMEMQRALGDLNRELEPRFGVALRMGGGIHTGDAHVGNMGTADLMDYTAIGDTVNTASRIEGMCSKYGQGIVVSGDTAERVDDPTRFALRQLDLVRVKGRKHGIPIYTVYTPEEAAERAAELASWDEALALYLAGSFGESHRLCKDLRAKRPEEKLYEIFTERTELMLREPPKEWDGIFTYESK